MTQGTLPGFIPNANFAYPLYHAWGFIVNVALSSFVQVFFYLTGNYVGELGALLSRKKCVPSGQMLVSDWEGLSAGPHSPETSPLCTPARPMSSHSIWAPGLQWELSNCWFRFPSLSTAQLGIQFSNFGTCPWSPIAPSWCAIGQDRRNTGHVAGHAKAWTCPTAQHVPCHLTCHCFRVTQGAEGNPAGMQADSVSVPQCPIHSNVGIFLPYNVVVQVPAWETWANGSPINTVTRSLAC